MLNAGPSAASLRDFGQDEGGTNEVKGWRRPWCSDGVGISFRGFTRFPGAGSLERNKSACPVKVDDGVELLGQTRVKVMTEALAVRTVDDADGAFEAWLA